MAGSERINVMRVLTSIINELDDKLDSGDLNQEASKQTFRARREVWLIHQAILTAELSDRIKITKAKTKTLSKIANDLKASDAKLKEIAGKIKKAAEAVDKLVEMTAKAVELAKKVAALT